MFRDMAESGYPVVIPNAKDAVMLALMAEVAPEAAKIAGSEKLPPDIIRNAGNTLALAVTSHAYEQELLRMLRANAKNRLSAGALGIDLKKEILASRHRLALAREAESMHSRGVLLFPKSLKEPRKYGAECVGLMNRAVEKMTAYDKSLKAFHAAVQSGVKKRGMN